jgi:hypothetical protein
MAEQRWWRRALLERAVLAAAAFVTGRMLVYLAHMVGSAGS